MINYNFNCAINITKVLFIIMLKINCYCIRLKDNLFITKDVYGKNIDNNKNIDIQEKKEKNYLKYYNTYIEDNKDISDKLNTNYSNKYGNKSNGYIPDANTKYN